MTLTDRQQQVLDYLRQQIDTTGLPPTIHELMQAFGWASPRAASKHLEALIAAGAIEMAPHKARTIQLAGARRRPDTLELPLVGRVAAGEPILSDGSVERTVAVDRWMFRPSPDFLLRVEGDSMIDDGILDGDLVAGKATPDAEHGQIVIARLGDAGITIKRLHKRGRTLRLLPRNPHHAPIDPDPTEDFAIEGIYCGLLRRA
ncbi:repressor LexA [Pseudoxanthomonas broegbernensis]|uniref:LexA repressor n=1 Tax=Pseudoxanthomonas broegbernensis TaxID=83619 RepID=A0A7V8K868_9GAMM|nr:transcriptional repressor LexA [Pseudoxanthomonas broegbernensis]KAF1687980.1 repressor LexA [Pseudoxanthomonas broegbernensis]MBB6064995.1 repressor LexA [Pseudoxanthomonas broegbernensis]